jgi:hypothetical protein
MKSGKNLMFAVPDKSESRFSMVQCTCNIYLGAVHLIGIFLSVRIAPVIVVATERVI